MRRFALPLCLILSLAALLIPSSAKSADSYVPLPRSCGRVLPGTSSTDVCCMFGYVFVDGQAVDGAQVVISGPGGTLTPVWTTKTPENDKPFFSVDLKSAPLNVQPEQTISITATYAGLSHTITHKVLGGGQQVDIVIPVLASTGYVFDKQFWKAAQPGQLNSPAGIATDANGTIYVADRDNARIQVFDTSGTLIQGLGWGTRGDRPGEFVAPVAVAISPQGEVFVADRGNDRIQVFSITGEFLRMWGTEGNGTAQLSFPNGIALAPNGDVYVADSGNHRIQHYTRMGVHVEDGLTPGTFTSPVGVAIDAAGNLYVGDQGASAAPPRIQRRTTAGIWSVISSGQFSATGQMTIGPDGSLYVSDTTTDLVYRRSTPAGTGSWNSFGGTGTAAGRFNMPNGLAFTPAGDLLVVEQSNHRVQQLTASGVPIRTWGSHGSSLGQFITPSGVAIDSANNLYVAEYGGKRVQKINPDGQVLESISSLGPSIGNFGQPISVALNQQGELFVADQQRFQVLHRDTQGSWHEIGGFSETPGGMHVLSGMAINPQQQVVVAEIYRHRLQAFTLDGTSVAVYGDTQPNAGNALGSFNGPNYVTFDSAGNMYVSELYNQRVQKRSPNGTWSIALSQAAAQLESPAQLTTDSSGNIFLVDQCSNRVIKFNSAGVQAIFGGVGTGAGRFECPEGVAVDSLGRVYVADSIGNRIQRFRPQSFHAPIATIVQNGALTLRPGEPLKVIGRGADSDTTNPVTLEWRIDGQIRSVQDPITPAFSDLPIGPHTVSLIARDSAGNESTPISLPFSVGTGVVVAQPVTWTMLLYLVGDNDTALYMGDTDKRGAFGRLRNAGPHPNVTVVVQYDGPEGDDTSRAILSSDGTFTPTRIPEQHMDDPQTLVDFVQWGQKAAPSTYTYLAIADHADAITGIGIDLHSGSDQWLTNSELLQALNTITVGGSHKIDILHLDGCLMGLVENAYQMQTVANIMVASPNLGWSVFPYESYRAAVTLTTTPDELSKTIVNLYSSRLRALQLPYTLSAIDLRKLGPITNEIDTIASQLSQLRRQSADMRSSISTVRSNAQKYDSNYDKQLTTADSYIDLYDWARLLKERINDDAIDTSVDRLLPAIRAAVYERHDAGMIEIAEDQFSPMYLDNSHGLGIYYPTRNTAAASDVYLRGLLFATDPGRMWDELIIAEATSTGVTSSPSPHPLPPLALGANPYHTFLPFMRR